MADVKQFELNGTYYPAKDVTARTSIGKILDGLADEFSTSASYSVGDYVVYDGDIYRFVINHEAGSWDSTEVTIVAVGDELVALKALIDSRADFYLSGSITSGTNSFTVTDSRIDSDHWVVEDAYFDKRPTHHKITWTTNTTAHTVTLSGDTFGAASVIIKMVYKQ